MLEHIIFLCIVPVFILFICAQNYIWKMSWKKKTEKKRKIKRGNSLEPGCSPANPPRTSSTSGLLARPTRRQANPRAFPLSVCG